MRDIAPPTALAAKHRTRRGHWLWKLLFGIIGLSVVGMIMIVCMLVVMKRISGRDFDGVKHDQYQAIFLSNNQAYFGKVTSATGNIVKLEDVWYIQQSGANSPTSTPTNPLILNHLGTEVHGPEDIMMIEKRQILFWENLKNDSKVVQTIKSQK